MQLIFFGVFVLGFLLPLRVVQQSGEAVACATVCKCEVEGATQQVTPLGSLQTRARAATGQG